MLLQSELDYPRRVMVDDTDSRIRYEGGSWTLDVGSFAHRGVYGPPFNQTMHGTNQSGSSFSFTFEGAFVQVRGAKDTRKIAPENRNNNLALPDWTCKVDGLFIDAFYYYNATDDTTNDVLCEQGNLTGIAHTLTLVVNITDPTTQMFWFDSIEYTPVSDADLANEVMRVDATDPSVKYHNDSGDWIVGDNGSFIYTETQGASLSFEFNGTDVSLYTFIEGTDEHWRATTASYTIDNNSSSTDFHISGSRPGPDGISNTDYFNELLFTTPSLSPGSHTMNLQLTGQQNEEDPTQGLTIDYFFVTISDDSAQLNVSSPDGHNSTSSGSRHSSVGAIVGGVIGGLIGLGLLGLGAFFFMKWRRKRKAGTWKYSEIIPFDTEPSTPYSPSRFSIDSKRSRLTATSGSAALESPEEPPVIERHHEDSGVRYTQPASRVVDIPPNYTEA